MMLMISCVCVCPSEFLLKAGSMSGGGGGGQSFYFIGGPGKDGAKGAVRIIWGSGRSYPSTNTANV
jgi:hypothetical protein